MATNKRTFIVLRVIIYQRRWHLLQLHHDQLTIVAVNYVETNLTQRATCHSSRSTSIPATGERWRCLDGSFRRQMKTRPWTRRRQRSLESRDASRGTMSQTRLVSDRWDGLEASCWWTRVGSQHRRLFGRIGRSCHEHGNHGLLLSRRFVWLLASEQLVTSCADNASMQIETVFAVHDTHSANLRIITSHATCIRRYGMFHPGT